MNSINHLSTFILAQAGGSSIQGALSKVLGLFMLIGFLYGVVKIIGACANYNRDPDGAKQSIIAGVLIAASVAIVTVLFSAFGIDVGLSIDTSGL